MREAEHAARRAELERLGIDPESAEGEDGPGNEAWQRAQQLALRVRAEDRN